MSKKIEQLLNPNRTDTLRHPNGIIASKTPYVDDKKNGTKKVWSDSGQKEHEMTWRHGKQHGLSAAWDRHGTKRQEVTWRHGKQHGLTIELDDSGIKWPRVEGVLANGKQHGVETVWWDSGKKRQERYSLDDEDYADIRWDEDGKVNRVNFPPLLAKPKPNPKQRITISSPG